jgi:hypothetical protein
VSARSALTKGSDRDSFVLIHSEVQTDRGVVQRVRRPREVSRL